MRHFVGLTLAVTALTLGMGMTPATAALVAPACGLHATSALLRGALAGAIALATVTVAADKHRGAAASAQEASGRWLHRRNSADGGWAGQSPMFREILTSATSPSRARDATSGGLVRYGRCRVCFKLLRLDQFLPHLPRPGYFDSSPPSRPAHQHTPLAPTARKGVFALALRAPSNTPLRESCQIDFRPLPPDSRAY